MQDVPSKKSLVNRLMCNRTYGQVQDEFVRITGEPFRVLGHRTMNGTSTVDIEMFGTIVTVPRKAVVWDD